MQGIEITLQGRKTQIALVVPTMSREELGHIMAGNEPTKEIIEKATLYALERDIRAQSRTPDEDAGMALGYERAARS